MQQPVIAPAALVVGCPGREVLSDLTLGKLPLAAIEMIGVHVEQCHGCQEVLQSLDYLEDSFVSDLKYGPIPEMLPIRPELERQLQAAEAISRVVWRTLQPMRRKMHFPGRWGSTSCWSGSGTAAWGSFTRPATPSSSGW